MKSIYKIAKQLTINSALAQEEIVVNGVKPKILADLAKPTLPVDVTGLKDLVVQPELVTSKASLLERMFTEAPLRLAFAGILTANAMKAKSKAAKEGSKAQERKSFLEKLRDQVSESGAGLNCGSADVNQVSPDCKSTNPETITPDDASLNPGLASANFGTSPEKSDSFLSSPKCVTNTGSYDPNAAARLNKMNDALLKKNPNLLKASMEAKKKADLMSKQIANQLGTSGASLASLGSDTSDSILSASSPIEALKQLRDELKQEIGNVESSGSASSNPSGLDLSGLGGVAVEETLNLPDDSKLAEVMGSEFDMGNSDINTESSSNIFDILSNRYRRSGIRRLLGAEQIIPSDKASTSDINK